MKITVVVENFADIWNVIAEYGLSILIEDGQTQVLMDTGQGDTLIPNMSALGIKPEKIDHLVLSHGHFDHAGGAQKFLLRSRNIPVWAHPEVGMGHSRYREGVTSFVGCHLNTGALDLRPVTGLTAITGNVWGIEIPMDHRDPDLLSVTDHLVVPSGGGLKPDLFPDDISLVVKGENGLSVIFGCAHAGAVNILEEVSARFGTREFYTVIGGMHLGGQSDEYIEKVTSELVSRFRVSRWRPCHCSGFKAAFSLARKAEDVSWAGAGTVHQV